MYQIEYPEYIEEEHFEAIYNYVAYDRINKTNFDFIKALTNTMNTNNIDTNEVIQYSNGEYPPGYSPYGWSSGRKCAVATARAIAYASEFLQKGVSLTESNLILIDSVSGKKVAEFYVETYELRKATKIETDPMLVNFCLGRVLMAVDSEGELYVFY